MIFARCNVPSMQLNAAGHAASQVLKERCEAIAQRVASLYFEAHPATRTALGKGPARVYRG